MTPIQPKRNTSCFPTKFHQEGSQVNVLIRPFEPLNPLPTAPRPLQGQPVAQPSHLQKNGDVVCADVVRTVCCQRIIFYTSHECYSCKKHTKVNSKIQRSRFIMNTTSYNYTYNCINAPVDDCYSKSGLLVNRFILSGEIYLQQRQPRPRELPSCLPLIWKN